MIFGHIIVLNYMQKFSFINRIPVKPFKIIHAVNSHGIDITLLLCGIWSCGIDSDMT